MINLRLFTQLACCAVVFCYLSSMGQPVKLSDELVLDARLTGEIAERSLAGQIEYWAKLGRAAEDNPDLPIDFIKDILASKGQNRRLAETFKSE